MELLARHFFVNGRVQGVGFRYFVHRTAQTLGICGWVRNLPSGEVEVWAEGTSIALEALRRTLESGPSGARVAQVRDANALPAHYDNFEITR